MVETKPFGISKRAVWEAYQRVKENRGAAGVDGQSLEDFERDLANNLYKLWNRLASGSYFPPPVLAVEIPKAGGGKRRLGVPTVSDRIAQMVVKQAFEPEVEPFFPPDSYGYRPGKSALQAVGVTRQRCWQYDYVREFDIKGLFDAIDHRLLRRAVDKHTDCRWVRLYIERWLVAPFVQGDGMQVARTSGSIFPLSCSSVWSGKSAEPKKCGLLQLAGIAPTSDEIGFLSVSGGTAVIADGQVSFCVAATVFDSIQRRRDRIANLLPIRNGRRVTMVGRRRLIGGDGWPKFRSSTNPALRYL
jgi:hypothetical protein